MPLEFHMLRVAASLFVCLLKAIISDKIPGVPYKFFFLPLSLPEIQTISKQLNYTHHKFNLTPIQYVYQRQYFHP